MISVLFHGERSSVRVSWIDSFRHIRSFLKKKKKCLSIPRYVVGNCSQRKHKEQRRTSLSLRKLLKRKKETSVATAVIARGTINPRTREVGRENGMWIARYNERNVHNPHAGYKRGIANLCNWLIQKCYGLCGWQVDNESVSERQTRVARDSISANYFFSFFPFFFPFFLFAP